MNVYKNWISENQNAVAKLLEEELDYWLQQVSADEMATGRPGRGDAYQFSVEVPAGNGQQSIDVQNRIITALLFALHGVTGKTAHTLFREGHGRISLGKIDVSEAIGWFTCKYPTKYRLAPGNMLQTLDNVTESNSAVPHGGAGFDVLKYFGPGYLNRQLECASGILFNYLGDLTFTANNDNVSTNGQLILSAHSGFTSTMEYNEQAGEEGLFDLNVNAWISGGLLYCQVDMTTLLGWDAAKCQRFAEQLKVYLNELVAAGRSTLKGGVTPFQKGLISYVFNHPESESYINQNVFETGAGITYEFFRRVCGILTEKYEILHTCYDFDYATGEFTSELLPADALVCDHYEMQNDHMEQELADLLASIKQRRIQIANEPLIRFSLISAGERNIIVITSHHIIIDGTSVMYLLNELMTIAANLKSGADVVTRIPENLKFSNYIKWINAKDEQAATNYWKNLLSGATPALLENNTTGTASSDGQFGSLTHRFKISQTTQNFLKGNHITIASALNYLVGYTLSVYMGTDSFVWGNTVTVRPFELDDMETIVGPCIATIPVIMNFNSGERLSGSIKMLQEQLLESREHACLPLNDIYKSAGQQQLFSVSYVYQNFISAAGQTPSGSYRAHLSQDGNISAHFPVNILVFEEDDALSIRIKYRKDYFTKHLVTDICTAVSGLFNNLGAIQDQPVREIDFFNLSGLKNSLLEGPVADITGITLHGAFEEMAARHPRQIAVIDRERQLSYEELDALGNRIAALIADSQVTGAIGIRMKRSVQMVAVIMGILKSGSHMVSLEHDFPDEKIEWIAGNTGLTAIFTDDPDGFKTNLPVFHTAAIEPLNKPYSLPAVPASALCCINYTSGSTGTPKLVKINHEGHVNRVLWLKHACAATANDVYGFKTLLCFGPSLREVFEPLMQGSTLYVYSNESNNNPSLFHDETGKYRVTRLFLTPTFIRLMYDCELQQAFAGLEYLEISGEPIAVEMYERLKKDFPLAKIVGRYGATEAPGTVYFTGKDYKSGRNLPLGKPIQNTGVAVLNGEGKILPTGVIGEIAISGSSVSTGYVSKEPEAAHFITVKGVRYVKTGDMGFIDHDDILVFQSRKTRMLKIRGYRVEPAEIEYNLLQHPAVRKAIVVPVVSKNNTRIAVFYIKTETVTAGALRRFLEQRLPPYMVPNEFIEIGEIPLTESGKVDYISLSRNAIARNTADEHPPEPGLEQDIFEIISGLVGHRQFDVLSNLIEIGMDSILVLKAIYKIRKQSGVQVVVADMYMNPTVRGFAGFIKNKAANGEDESRYYMVNYKEDNEFLFFVPPIGNSQIDIKALEDAVPGNVTLVIFQPVGAEEAAALSIETIAAGYNQYLLQMNKGTAINISGWSLGATIAYEMAVQLEKNGCRVNSLLLFDPGFHTPEYDQSLTPEKMSDILNSLMGAGAGDMEIRKNILADLVNANKLIVDYLPTGYTGTVQLFKPVDISPGERNYNQQMNGLDRYCKGEIKVTRLRGNHMTMLGDTQQNKQIISESVKQRSATSAMPC